MEYCKLTSTPLCANSKLNTDMGEKLVNKQLYRAPITCLICATITRIHTGYVERCISRFITTLQEPHHIAAKRILRYLAGTFSCIKLVYNHVLHVRTKHIEIQHHFIQEKSKARNLQVNCIPTSQQEAVLG
uniref:Reverse transcriptase Ty1/copia-type domain-containing protein n=1 Tax=Physcomitrium patens TaxID=3218 RepID=A0A2K1KHK6_PHYPA|nr:hypothetical protein PHYPA_009615 [Physcomitrium patens]